MLCNPPVPAMGCPLDARLVFFLSVRRTLYSGLQQHFYTAVDDPPRAQQPMHVGSVMRTGHGSAFSNFVNAHMSATDSRKIASLSSTSHVTPFATV